MSLTQQLLAAMRHECQIIKHLAGKIPPGTLDYRPTPPQRSTLELIRYLTYCAVNPVTAALAGNWDHAPANRARGDALAPEDVPAAMDAQAEALAARLAPITDTDLVERTAKLPWGAEVPLGEALIQMGVKPLAAYRMQLFLYCKAAGASELTAANCWIGIDRPTPA